MSKREFGWARPGEETPDDAYVSPRAEEVVGLRCPDPNCPHLHVILCDEQGMDLAQGVVSREQLLEWLALLPVRH